MPSQYKVPEPEAGLKFIDAHCHIPFPRPRNDKLPSNDQQYKDYLRMGGVYLITCSIDIITLNLVLDFIKGKKNIGFTCGWAPQTVTYTQKSKHSEQYKKWIEYILNNPEKYLAIGEIGLDFHHAKTLDKRNKQVEIFKKILASTTELDKPYVLHVRNAAKHEFDRNNPKHRFNNNDGANKEIIRILKEFKINSKKVLWHCFSGPEEYGRSLPNHGFMLSVPSSSYGVDRWRNATKNSPIEYLVTETDAYYQHPYKRGPVNVPSNARYSISAIAYSHNLSQNEVSEKTVDNAKNFFNLEIE